MPPAEQHWSSLRESAEAVLRKTRSDVAALPEQDVQRLVHELQVHQVELQMQNDELRLTAHQLEETRNQYRELFELAPAGYLALDSNAVIRRANIAAAILLDLNREELVGKPLAQFVDRLDVAALQEHLSGVVQRNVAMCELRLARPDGSPASVRLGTSQALMPAAGYLVALMDVTEQRRAEAALNELNQQLEQRVAARTVELAEQNRLLEEEIAARTQGEQERRRLAERLREAERLESLGLLAGGIAHDFNNLLVGVLANADLLLREKSLPGKAREPLKLIERAARCASGLTRQMLVYAGKGDVELAPVNLQDAMYSSLEQLRPSVPQVIELQVERGDPPPIQADRTQVEQVITNLITNGVQAIGERPGTVRVRTSSQELDAKALADFTRTVGAQPGRFAVLEVTDTGVGMSGMTLSRIFDPFFTTKAPGRGLGLASVLGILQGHGCAARVRSCPEKGTTFEIAWPLAVTPRVSSVVPSTTGKWRGAGRVLVIDDDEAVLAAVARQLEFLGFETVKAHDGAEGLRLLHEATVPFTLVVLDRTMPGLSGVQVLEQIREHAPEQPVVMMSGYSPDAAATLPAKGVTFVQKPMGAEELACAARAVLEPQAIAQSQS